MENFRYNKYISSTRGEASINYNAGERVSKVKRTFLDNQRIYESTITKESLLQRIFQKHKQSELNHKTSKFVPDFNIILNVITP